MGGVPGPPRGCGDSQQRVGSVLGPASSILDILSGFLPTAGKISAPEQPLDESTFQGKPTSPPQASRQTPPGPQRPAWGQGWPCGPSDALMAELCPQTGSLCTVGSFSWPPCSGLLSERHYGKSEHRRERDTQGGKQKTRNKNAQMRVRCRVRGGLQGWPRAAAAGARVAAGTSKHGPAASLCLTNIPDHRGHLPVQDTQTRQYLGTAIYVGCGPRKRRQRSMAVRQAASPFHAGS